MLTIGLYRDLSDWAGKLTGKTAQSGAGWIAVKAKGGLSDSAEVTGMTANPMDPRLREDDAVIGAANQYYPSTGAGLSPLPKHQHQPHHNRPHPHQTQRRHAIPQEQEIQQRGAAGHQVEQTGDVHQIAHPNQPVQQQGCTNRDQQAHVQQRHDKADAPFHLKRLKGYDHRAHQQADGVLQRQYVHG
tara:strand:- start:4 stop:564 length:561 start_codon:yes stop_codon:yes gene_type:complete